jgi:hypothetical protein
VLEDTYTVLVFTSVAIPQTKTKRERQADGWRFALLRRRFFESIDGRVRW